MSEESPENFNSGDVVWVKLGSSWWPGEVKDSEELPNDIDLDFKKPPLVIVKFFDEDSYEYIKSWANIYPYNCEKKNEFIKKGMAAFRAKVPHMDKFPKDVLTAESKVGGNPNILSDPMFLPDKKKNYAAEIFGTPSPKVKVNKDKRRSNPKSSQKNTAHITHRRFLGVDDYRAYICIQYPGKDRIPGDKEDEEVLRINREPEQEFNCHTCSFTTKRLEVMILHTKSHIQGVYVSSPRKNKQSAVRKKKQKTKKSRSTDDVIESESSSSDSEPVRERKRKPKSQSAKESKAKKTEEKETPNQSIDIRNELLAVWDDSNDDDDEFDISLDKLGKSQKLSHSTLEGVLSGTIVDSADESLNQSLDDAMSKSEALGAMVEETLEQIRAEVTNPSEVEVVNQSEAATRSLEDALNPSAKKALDKPGEKSEELNQSNQSTEEPLNEPIPPDQSDEKGSKESTDEIAKDKPSDASSVEKETLKDESKPDSATDSKETEKAEKKMDRDIREAIKSCFDFDEDDEEDNAIVSKAATGGRKIPRVIPLTEKRKSKDIIEEDLKRGKLPKDGGSYSRKEAGEGNSEEVDAAFKELMEMTTVPELPEVHNTLKCEQNFHNIKTIKFPDKPEPVGSPPKVTKVEKKDSSEVATKLTNPKKRFVKSFEDFELMQNEIRRKEEQGELARNEEIKSKADSVEKSHEASSSVTYKNFDDFDTSSGSPSDTGIELTKLKSKIMSKIIEEAKINEESKCKIMSKIHEPKAEPAESKYPSYEDRKPEKEHSTVSHRTPRSKILESYMKDTNNQKAEEHKKRKAELEISQPRTETRSNNREVAEDRKKEAVMRKDVVPPKKNKWSRRGSHPKKDRNLFLLEDIRLDDPPAKEVQKDEKPEESIKRDNQESLATLDAVDKAPTITNDSAVEDFVPFSTNNEMILAKEILVEGLNKGTDFDGADSKFPSVEKESKEIVSRQEEDSEIVLSTYKETDKVSSLDEENDKPSIVRDETVKLHMNDNERGTATLFSKYEESEKLPLEDQEIDVLTSKNEETEKLHAEHQIINRLTEKNVETEKLPSSFQEMDETTSKEIEVPYSNYQEIEKASLEDEEIEITSLKDEDTEKVLSKDEEGDKVPSKGEETAKACLKNEETDITLEVDETVKPSTKDEELVKLSSTDEETVELPSKEEGSEKILENQVSEKLSGKDEEKDRLELDYQESEKTLVNEEESDLPLKEVDHLFGGKSEFDNLPPNEREPQDLLENEEKVDPIINEECKVAAVENTVKLDVSDHNSIERESVTIENETLPLNNILEEDCVVPSYQPTTSTDDDKLNMDIVVADKKLILSGECSSVSPGREVSVPMDSTGLFSPKKSIRSPPKKSKKRKMSESNASNLIKTDAAELEVENFSPSEKRKKEIDFKDKETTPVLDKHDFHSSELEFTDIQEGCRSEVVDNGTEVNEPDMKSNITPVKDDETTCAVTESVVEVTEHNKVEIQCASSSVESFKFSIQTNLSNLTSREEMSALALATLSEIKADLENSNSSLSDIREEVPKIRGEVPEIREEETEIREAVPEIKEKKPEIREEVPEIREAVPELRQERAEIREKEPEIREQQPVIREEVPEIREEVSEIREEVLAIREEVSEIGEEPPQIIEELSQIIEEPSPRTEDPPKIKERPPQIIEEPPHTIEEPPQIIEEPQHIIEEPPQIIEEPPQIIEDPPKIREGLPQIIEEPPQIIEEPPQIIEEPPQIIEEPPQIIEDPPKIKDSPQVKEKLSQIKEPLQIKEQPKIRAEPEMGVPLPIPVQSELVPIEGNLTVVSEKDLADGQVEITTEKVITPKKPITLSNFSMDFSDSGSDSNSTNDTIGDTSRSTEFTSKGTEFTSKAMTKQIKRLNKKKENAYERLELLNILEGNSDSEKKPKEYQQPPKKTIMEDICDFEEHIPSQIVCAKGLKRGLIDTEGDFAVKEKSQKMSEKSTASKLLERLTESKAKATPTKTSHHSEMNILEGIGKFPTKIQSMPSTTKQTKYVIKSKTPANINKPIILSEQIIKPASETKSKPKRMLNDIEDVEAFVIHKDPKKNKPDEEIVDTVLVKTKSAAKSAGKAKILQQTIITPAGEIIQPTVNQAQTDDNIFDINSMPIVLSDEILTPESIENMPIVIGTETKSVDHEKPTRRPTQGRIITKTTVATTQPAILNKTHTITKHSKPPRILQTVGSKIVKNSPLLPNTAKPGKYIIVPQSGIQQNKYISKKAPIMKRSPVPTGILTKVPNIAPEPSGNKIMIVTNQQGQQQRLLLTPAQQKLLYHNQKVTKTVVKGNMLQKSVLATKSVPLVEAGTSGVIAKSPSIIGQKVMVGTNSSPGLITTTTSHQVITNQGRNIKNVNVTKRVSPATQKVYSNAIKQKTILIKNQHGQTVRKIQGTDDELLDKQVAEQLEAIKASSGMKFSTQPKQTETYKITPKSTVRRSSKKIEVKPKLSPPPLSGIQQSPKSDKLAMTAFPSKKPDSIEVKPTTPLVTEEAKPDRPLNQLVIQDALGNQTTITEGQILALPSETVDGQPQSYMLVTLDETGNLTPLNSETLMSLDPNLGLGGDLSNMVLQIDQGAQTIPIKTSGITELAKTVMIEPPAATVPVPEASIMTEVSESPVVEQKIDPIVEMPQAVVPSTNGDPGQQLIVTGDPIATQKFLESLTEGTTDLANILANADGNSILIQADGQQILINTNSDNQMVLSMNNDSINVSESTEGGGNPIFATQPTKNQDILAAALADTDVFQQEQHSTQGKITSQLSPNNTLYPMNVGNVLETSLTLSSPIMTPLEVPSTNNKKIPDEEADILTQVPKNVDLPITITDPNISQTVANQQVASLIANELQANLELTLPISETTISSVSTEMNSPSFVYSLPTLDDSVDITQKPFNSSMPLLNEDVEDNSTGGKTKTDEDGKLGNETSHKSDSNNKQQGVNSEGCFLEEEEGRFTLGGEMCSSLSEPPPEMFDLPEVNPNFVEKRDTNIPSLQSTSDVSDNTSKEDDTTDLSTQADTSSEGSCEIPLQPQIVTKSLDLSRNLDSLKRSLEESREERKKCKFD